MEPVKGHLLNGMIKLMELTAERQTLVDYIRKKLIQIFNFLFLMNIHKLPKRQATVTETLDELIRKNTVDWVEEELISRNIINKLIVTLANTKHPESQRIASRALMVTFIYDFLNS